MAGRSFRQPIVPPYYILKIVGFLDQCAVRTLEEGLDNPHGRVIITGNSKSAYSRVSTRIAKTYSVCCLVKKKTSPLFYRDPFFYYMEIQIITI